MSYKLEQPYTDIEKADFIVEYNHKKNLKIVENNNTIFALEDLCVELERSNPLLDTMAAELNITPETLDKIFKYVNGELEVFPEAQHNA